MLPSGLTATPLGCVPMAIVETTVLLVSLMTDSELLPEFVT
ncbi:MAG: hypothetical protein WDN04_18700 [Rhodospirillales bacterium]